MSKHDFSTKKTEDRSEQLLSSDAFAPERSGLGKEIKISLAAITVLLGVLGYVLYGHFYGSDEESGDTPVATTGTEDEAPETDAAGTDPTGTDPAGVSVSTDRSMAGGATATATTESQWEKAIGQEQPSTSQSATRNSSPAFSFMERAAGRTPAAPAPMPQTATDQYPAYGGGSTVETSTNTRSSDGTADYVPYSGHANDPFQRRTAQDTAGSYASQRQAGGHSSQPQTGGQGVHTYGQSTGSQTYSSWPPESQASAPATAPGTAVVSSETDTAASDGFRQSATPQSRTFQQEDVPDHAATGSSARIQSTSQYAADSRAYGTGNSSLRIQSTPRYSTDSHGYVTSDTSGHTGGTGSTQVESRSSSQGYNDYNASPQSSVQSSVPRASAGLSNVSTSPDSSQYGLSGDKPSGGKYTIQPNDNYYSISKKRYDTGSYFKALAQHNRAAFPDANRLGVGKEIETPDESELVRLYPDLCPKPEHREASKHRALAAGTASRSAGATVYVVQEGDTLFDIARYELGKASRWAEIYQLNRDRLGKDFDYLTPGLELVMPPESVQSDQPVGTMTQRSGARRQF